MTTQKEREWKRSWYRKNRDKVLEQVRKYREVNKEKVALSHKHYQQIDHIQHNGSQDRKRNGHSATFYRYLIDNNYPAGYQVLCANCNWIKEMDRRSGN